MPIRYTQRGFATYADLQDTHGSRVTVRQSSAAMIDAIWIYINHRNGQGGSAHLTADQAATLVLALQEWLDSLDDPSSATQAP